VLDIGYCEDVVLAVGPDFRDHVRFIQKDMLWGPMFWQQSPEP
jgi:hypothetical protein